MSTYRRPSTTVGQTGWRRGAPSFRSVARKPSPTPNWQSSFFPASARSGASVSNSLQVAIANALPDFFVVRGVYAESVGSDIYFRRFFAYVKRGQLLRGSYCWVPRPALSLSRFRPVTSFGLVPN